MSCETARRGITLAIVCAGILGCSGGMPAPPPRPADLDALEPALSTFVRQAIERVEDDPRSLPAYESLCRVYHANGLNDLAIPCYENVLAVRSGRAIGWYHLAQARWESGDRPGAIDAMREAIERFEVYAPAHARLGRWLLATGDLDGAEKAFTRVLQIDPTSLAARLGMAQVVFERGADAEAVARVEALLAEDPAQPAARVLLDEMRGLSDAPGSVAQLELPLLDGRMLGNDPWSAELDMFRVTSSARLGAAESYLSAKRPETAAEILEKVHEEAPDSAVVQIRLGQAYLQSGKNAEALALLTEAAVRHPGNPAVHRELASVQELTGDSAAALVSIERSIELDPEVALAWSRKGAILRRAGRYADAADAFRRARELTPDDAHVVRALGDCLTRVPDWDGAAEAYDRALELEPDDADLLARAGLVYVKQGRFDDAERVIEAALAQDPPRSAQLRAVLEQIRGARARSPG